MEQQYWLKQAEEPLFPELEWSRPETRAQAGKLLIVGGNGYEFRAPANAYGDALNAGIGAATVLLPSSMQKVVGNIFPEAEFAPSTPSGSFARSALDQLLRLAAWADGVLLAGDTGRNSETTVVLETFLQKYQGPLVITKDTADVLLRQPQQLIRRPDTLLVLATGQLRELGSSIHHSRAFTSDMGIVQLADALHDFTGTYSVHIITRHQEQYIVAADGQVSTTLDRTESSVWRIRVAAQASVWWLQNPSKPFEALTTAVYS